MPQPVTQTANPVVLVAAARTIVEATSAPPLLSELPVAQARKVLESRPWR